jgi:competence protein ComEA
LFILSKQEKIVLLLIISVVIIFFAWRLYLQEKNSITIISAQQVDRETEPVIEGVREEEICIIHIAGAVNQPGVYQLSKGKRIIDAVKAAGEATEKANLDAVNLAAPIYDGQKIIIPYFIADEATGNEIRGSSGLNLLYPEYSSSQGSNLININICSVRELESLDGIGPVLAERIVEYRKNNGLFSRIEDIKNVSGIGEKKFEAIKEMIAVY